MDGGSVNYGIFAVIVLLRPTIEPLLALFISSLIAMVFAYLGMRFAAFRPGSPPAWVSLIKPARAAYHRSLAQPGAPRCRTSRRAASRT